MNRKTRRRTVSKAAGLIASLALLASASSVFASENSHVVTWQLPSGAWSGHSDFFNLPDRSYGFKSDKVKQSATFDQTLVGEGQLKPDCGEWAQVDFYKIDGESDQALYDSLLKGGVLGYPNGHPADSAIYSSNQGYGFYFVYGGDCEQPSESPSEQPSESPSEQPSEQPSQEPSETPTGTVDAATGTPTITLPPTSTIDGAGPTSGDGGLPIALFGLIGLTALIALVTPTPAKARRRNDRD